MFPIKNKFVKGSLVIFVTFVIFSNHNHLKHKNQFVVEGSITWSNIFRWRIYRSIQYLSLKDLSLDPIFVVEGSIARSNICRGNPIFVVEGSMAPSTICRWKIYRSFQYLLLKDQSHDPIFIVEGPVLGSNLCRWRIGNCIYNLA